MTKGSFNFYICETIAVFPGGDIPFLSSMISTHTKPRIIGKEVKNFFSGYYMQ